MVAVGRSKYGGSGEGGQCGERSLPALIAAFFQCHCRDTAVVVRCLPLPCSDLQHDFLSRIAQPAHGPTFPRGGPARPVPCPPRVPAPRQRAARGRLAPTAFSVCLPCVS